MMTTLALTEVQFDQSIYPRAEWSQSTVNRYLRKHPDQWRDLNPHLTKESTLFVGNMANACGVPYVSTMVGRAGSSSRF